MGSEAEKVEVGSRGFKGIGENRGKCIGENSEKGVGMKVGRALGRTIEELEERQWNRM